MTARLHAPQRLPPDAAPGMVCSVNHDDGELIRMAILLAHRRR